MTKQSTVRKVAQEQGENARTKLIHAALELFAENGFDSASVRDIAQKAGQNIGSISYYFGDKKGLYTAVAEEIVGDMNRAMGARIQMIEEKLNHGPLAPEEYIAYMQGIITGMVMSLFQRDKHNRSAAQIFAREQFSPTHVLQMLYEQIHVPMHRLCCRLLGGYLGKDPESEEIIIRAYTLFGLAMMFRMGQEMVRLRTGWKSMGERELKLIAGIVSEHVELIVRGINEKRA